MVELVDTMVLEAIVERRAGSTPAPGTILCRLASPYVATYGLARRGVITLRNTE